MSTGALEGLRILEWGDMITAPYCGKLAADLGAEVIKLERPREGDKARWIAPFFQDIPGPDRSGLFLYVNTNKLGITLDPSRPTGRQLFLDLLKQVDVVVENQPVGFPDSVGLGYDVLRQVNDQVIQLSISPFGDTGPYKDYQATDLIIAQMSGLGYPQPGWEEATADRPPIRPGGRQADFGAGLTASVAMMHAVFQRQANGKGCYVDLSALDTAASSITTLLGPYLDGGRVARRVPAGTPAEQGGGGGRVPTKDGYLILSPRSWVDWQALVEIMGNPEWARGEQFQNAALRTQYITGVRPELWEWTRTQDKQSLYHAAQRRRITSFPVNSPEDIVNSEHLKAREFFVQVDHPETGPVKYLGAPAKFSKTPWSIRRPAPRLGEHNVEVYCNRMGYSREKLVELAEAGVI